MGCHGSTNSLKKKTQITSSSPQISRSEVFTQWNAEEEEKGADFFQPGHRVLRKFRSIGNVYTLPTIRNVGAVHRCSSA